MDTKKPFDTIREHLLNDTRVLLEGLDYEVLRTGSQEICVPIVGSDNSEGYLVITFKIPTGSRDGDQYDGYLAAQDYADKCAEKARKKAESEKKKADKIAKDKAKRAAAKAEKTPKGWPD